MHYLCARGDAIEGMIRLVWIPFLLAMTQGSWAREYVVDGQHPQASDKNPGTVKRPLRTISKAAEVDRLAIHV